MKRVAKFGVAVLATSILAASGLAQSKIGFINSDAVLEGTEEGKQGMAQIQDFIQTKRTQLQGKNAELKELQDRLLAESATLSSLDRGQLESDINQKQLEIRRFQEDTQAEINQRQNALLQRISEKVQKIIDEYAAQNSFVAIFMRDQTQAYVDPSLDITSEIVEIYNQRHSGQGSSGTGP